MTNTDYKNNKLREFILWIGMDTHRINRFRALILKMIYPFMDSRKTTIFTVPTCMTYRIALPFPISGLSAWPADPSAMAHLQTIDVPICRYAWKRGGVYFSVNSGYTNQVGNYGTCIIHEDSPKVTEFYAN